MSNTTKAALTALITALANTGTKSEAALQAMTNGAEVLDAINKLEAEAAATTRLREGMEYAGNVLSAWEDGDLAGAVNVLEGWAELSKPLLGVCELLDEGIRIAELIVENWEGKIADLVNELDDWRDLAIADLIERKALTEKPAVVIEVSGGNITGISSIMDVDAYVVDYDEGENNDLLPYVEDQGHALISLRESKQSRPEFCLEIIDLHERENVE